MKNQTTTELLDQMHELDRRREQAAANLTREAALYNHRAEQMAHDMGGFGYDLDRALSNAAMAADIEERRTEVIDEMIVAILDELDERGEAGDEEAADYVRGRWEAADEERQLRAIGAW